MLEEDGEFSFLIEVIHRFKLTRCPIVNYRDFMRRDVAVHMQAHLECP